ncbi:MAG: hypothetical protein U1C71_02315, partial [archaeon]|nr:hypothetical protein [archaeon]
KQLKKLYEEAKKDPERAKRFGDASRANLEIARAKHESLRETNPEYRESVRDKARVTIVNARAKAKRLRKTDPKYVERISDRTKALWKDSEWRANQTELIRSGLQRYWSLVRKGLLTEFRGRGLIKSTDNRAEKGEKLIAGTTKTPQSEAIERERKEQVEIAIQRLKPEEAEAITSTFFEGNDLSTTAENMGITLTQLNKILDNAYRKLVKELRNI